jgi:diguanylate cyclase (GGDEF)-like protein
MALDPNDIFQVYRLRHDRAGNIQHQLAGRFMFEDNNISVLEDYFGLLKDLEGPLDERKQRLIRGLCNSAYTDVVGAKEAQDGSRPDLLPEAQPPGYDASGTAASVAHTTASLVAPPPPVFDYHRPGMDAPQCLEFHRPSGKALLNGQALSEEELHQVMQNLEDGTAVLRYRGVHALPGMAKMETALGLFAKAEEGDDEEGLFGALQALKPLVDAGHLDPEHARTIHRAIYADPMLGDIGNKRAYRDFLSRPKEGVHVMLDANRFKAINDELGHATGDKAIKQIGGALRGAMDETVGRGQGKIFRVGGDEFAAHMPTYEHAAQFGRALRARLEAVPALGGTHRLSVSMGLGHTPEHADQALSHAKLAAHAVPHAQALHAHSLFPGHEGAIPTGEKPVNVTATLQAPHQEAPHVAPTPVEPAGPKPSGAGRA